jgi:hypothetical protein
MGRWGDKGLKREQDHEITPEELHEICLYHLDEIRLLNDKLVQWTKEC